MLTKLKKFVFSPIEKYLNRMAEAESGLSDLMRERFWLIKDNCNWDFKFKEIPDISDFIVLNEKKERKEYIDLYVDILKGKIKDKASCEKLIKVHQKAASIMEIEEDMWKENEKSFKSDWRLAKRTIASLYRIFVECPNWIKLYDECCR